MVSNLEFYDSVVARVRDYHSTVLGKVVIDNMKLAPPAVNKDNIHIP